MSEAFLLALPTWLAGAVLILVVEALSLAGLLAVRRSISAHVLEKHNDVAGFIISIIGVMYAVVLAFVVVIVWEDFGDATQIAQQEANDVRVLYRNAAGYPEPARGELRARLRDYADSAIRDEWPAMRHGESSPRTQAALDRVWDTLNALPVQGPKDQAVYAESLRRMNDLGDQRQNRLLASRDQVPVVLWAVLVIGGACTIGFTFLFGLHNRWAQVVMTVALAGIMALVLFVIVALDNPFSGDVAVAPDAMQLVQSWFTDR